MGGGGAYVGLRKQWPAAVNALHNTSAELNNYIRTLYKLQDCTMMYSRTSDNGPSEKRTTSLQQTHSVLRIEITIVITLKQPPRSGCFLIPDSGQDPNSQQHFSIQNCL